MAGRRKRQFTFRASIAADPMPVEEWRAAERLLARLIARSITHDHPEWFQKRRTESEESENVGSPAAAAAVADALSANVGDPAEESTESHDSRERSRQQEADASASP